MPPQLMFDLSRFNFDRPIITLDQVRQINPQRHELEQVSGIVYINEADQEIVGFKDITDDEFWVKGHMPGYPLMPGVLICESAAQLAAYFARRYDLLNAGDYIGFGGMDDVRFRIPVYPPTRLVICLKSKRVRPRVRCEFEFQAINNGELCAHGTIIGVPIARTQSVATSRKSPST